MSAKRIFAINAPQIHIANTTDNALGDITLRSTGDKGVHDILVKETNFKFSNGDVVIGEGGSIKSNSLQDSAGNDGITFSSGAINFHNRTANNINLGTGVFDTSQINSLEYPGNSLDHELNQIETALSQKETKTGHAAAKIATTNSSGELEYIKNKSLLDDIGTNTSSISTNTSNITTNTSSISTNTSNITTNINSISTNTSNITSNTSNITTNTNSISTNTSNVSTNTGNISTNTGNISTNTSNISTNTSNISTNTSSITTLDGAAVKKTGTQTITGDKTFESSQITLQAWASQGTRFRNYSGGSSYYANILYGGTSDVNITLPTSSGTLALYSQFLEFQSSVNANEDSIDALDANKLNLTGGTLTGKLTINDTTTAVTDEILLDLKSEATASGTSYTTIKLQKATNYGGLIKGYLEQGVDAGLEFFTLNNGTETSMMKMSSTGVSVKTTNVIGNFTCKSQNRAISIIDSGTNNYAELRAHADGNVSSLAHLYQKAYSQTFFTNGGEVLNLGASSTVSILSSGGSLNISTSGTPRVGIGAASNFPLQITGGVNPSGSYTRISPEHKDSVSGSPNFYVVASRTTTNPTSTAGADTDGKIGIECSDCSVKAHYYFFNSDMRIKKEITDLSDNESLSIIRDISCVKYKYIDTVGRGSNWTYGFIANQVAEVFPNAVRTMKNTIPDEMRDISNCDWSGNMILVPELSGSKYKLIYGNGDKEEAKVVDYSGGGFILDASYNQVYLYGREVNDFHILDKSKIYAVLTSAVQELDKEVKVLKQKLADEETKTAYFEMKINQLFSHLGI